MLYLMPAVYYGEDSGIAVCLAGLEEDAKYTALTIALDEEEPQTVSVDEKTDYFSTEVSFGGLRRGQMYLITGTAICDGNTEQASCLFQAQQGQKRPEPVKSTPKKLLKAKVLTTKQDDVNSTGAIGRGQSDNNKKGG